MYIYNIHYSFEQVSNDLEANLEAIESHKGEKRRKKKITPRGIELGTISFEVRRLNQFIHLDFTLMIEPKQIIYLADRKHVVKTE